MVNSLEDLYFTRNMTVDEVARYYLRPGLDMEQETYMQQKKELMEYISRVVEVGP